MPERHVAVFGDAANDVPMFRDIGGAQPALRVGMPHAAHDELISLSNVRDEVGPTLLRLCEARVVHRSMAELFAAGLSLQQIVAIRLRACLGV